MKYLCLIYEDETIWPRMSKEESDRMMSEYGALTNDLKASGQWLAGHALQPTSSATTVRVRNGSTLVTDGPFAETKEQLGGFYLIEANDLNNAIQVAARIPVAKYGSVEVRPIMTFG
ncbi:MAG: YciI family protein [Gemmatimonadota bacterium]|nr:YciI family protein [Gemmatimonadota bacterium]